MKGRSNHLLYSSCMTAALLCTSLPAMANPLDGNVTAGQATITESGKKLDIHQHSKKIVIDWRRFDIAPDEHTEFHQPNSNSTALNRIHSDSASLIEGKLTANGNIILVNQNGVMFGKGADIDVNRMVVSTADVDNAKFMNNDKFAFDKPGNPDAKIINKGHITAKEAGLVGFVAPNVENSGVIEVKLGTVQLASGDTATLDMYGDGLLNVAVSENVKSQLVSNTGKIQADGGNIIITAAAGKDIVNSMIVHSGTLRAQTVGKKNGKIIISAQGSNKTSKHGNSTALVSGSIDASGNNGGNVQILADNIALLKESKIDASGTNSGGTVLVGGDYQGKGSTPTAQKVIMQTGAEIKANAKKTGGKVILWSDDATVFAGKIDAKKGFVETSSKNILTAVGNVNAGKWLLDPNNITIQTAGSNTNIAGDPNFVTTDDNAIITTGSIQNALNAGTSVTITTSAAGGDSQLGNITVANNILKSNGNEASLTLVAHNDITVNSNVSISSNHNKLNITFQSDSDADGVNGGAIVLNGNSALTSNGGNIILSGGTNINTGYAQGNATNTAGITLVSGAAVNSGAGSITMRGKGYLGAGGNQYGISVPVFSSITATGAGAISLTGIGGGNSSDTIGYNHGVSGNNATIQSTGLGGIILTGYGGGIGSTGAGNYGVNVYGINGTGFSTTIGDIIVNGNYGIGGQAITDASGTDNNGVYANPLTNGTGNIVVNGIAGAGTGSFNYGVTYATATSTATNGGSITINGYGGSGNGFAHHGVFLNSDITSKDGNVTINGNTGIGGQAVTTANSFGIVIAGNTTVRSTGNATITFNGLGANNVSGSNYGIYFQGSSNILSASSAININGTGGGAGNNNIGIVLDGFIINNAGAANSAAVTLTGVTGSGTSPVGIFTNGTSGVGNANSSGDIHLITNGVNFTAGTNFQTTGNILVNPYTAGTQMSVGSATNGLQLTDTMLGYFNWGANAYLQLGDATNTAAMDINTARSYTKGLKFLTKSGSNITLSGALTNTKDITIDSGNDLIINFDISKTGAGTSNILLKAKNDIYTAVNRSIYATTGSANITFQSDSDADGVNAGAIYLNTSNSCCGTNITSNGGNIILSGGTDVNTGYAQGNSTNVNGIRVSNNSTINAGGGTITMRGKGYAGTGDNNNGVYLQNAVIRTPGAGAISISGIGGGSGASSNNHGLYATNSSVESTATSGGGITITGYSGDIGGSGHDNYGISLNSGGVGSVDGAIILNGNYGIGGQTVTNTTGNNNLGIYNGFNTIESTGNATITINGIGGGSGSGTDNTGVVNSNAVIRSTATNGGGITVNGYGGNNGHGVGLHNNITSKDGNIIINGNTGIGGQAITSTNSNGINLANGGNNVSSTGNATITMAGIGGGDGIGIAINNGAIVTSATGAINLTGTGGAGSGTKSGVRLDIGGNVLSTGAAPITITGIIGGGASSDGIGIFNSYGSFTNTVGGASAAGAISLITDKLVLGTNSVVQTTGNIFVNPYTAGTQMSVGSATNGLQLTDTMIGYLNWGTNSYLQFGDATNTAAMDINTALSYTKELKFLTKSGSDIALSGALTTTDDLTFDSGNNLVLNHNISKTGAGSDNLLLKAKNDITLAGNRSITSTTGTANITLQSDSDADGVNGGAIKIGDDSALSTISSNGGNIILSGGTNVNTGYAQGNSTNVTGVNIFRALIDSVGGAINIRGKGYAGTSNDNYGVYIHGIAATTVRTTGAGAISITGIGGGSGTSSGNHGVYNNNQGFVQSTATGGGAINIIGYSGEGSGGDNVGVNVTNISSVDGNIDIKGNYGIGGQVLSTATGNGNIGVQTNSFNAVRSNGNATITITGIGAGSGSSSGNYGFYNPYATVASTASNGGAITVTGYGGNAAGTGGTNYGVYILGSGSDSNITSRDGNIVINGNTGIGGQGVTASNGSQNHGIILAAGAVSSTEDATVTLNGIGGGTGGSSSGVILTSNGAVTSTTGNINITGTGGTGANAENYGIAFSGFGGKVTSNGAANISLTGIAGHSSSYGIASPQFTSSASIGGASATGNIELITDKIDFYDATTITVRTTGEVWFKPYTASTTIGIGGGTGTLQLTDDMLTALNVGSIKIGRTDGAGLITLNEYTGWADDVTIQNGSANISLGGNQTFATNKDITLTTATGNIITNSDGTLTVAGDGLMTFTSGNDINFTNDYNLVSTGTTGITLKGKRDIIQTGGGDVTTNNHDIIYNSDSDATSGGRISLGTGTVVTANGANITLGGGATPATVAAIGRAGAVEGILLSGSTLNAGGGSISVRGTGAAGHGIYGDDATIQTSGTGTVTLTGGLTGGTGSTSGIYLDDGAVSAQGGTITLTGTVTASGSHNTGITLDGGVQISNTSAGIINITGTGANGTTNNYGVEITGTGTAVTTQTGAINITGTGGTGSSTGNHGFAFTNSANIATTTGDVSITATGGNSATDMLFDDASFGNGTQSGDITLNINTLASGGSPTMETTGDVWFKPRTASTTIGVGGGTGTLQITDAILDSITAGNVVIGLTTGTGDITADTYSWANNLIMQTAGTSNININGVQTMGAHTLFARTHGTGDITIGASGGVTSSASGTAITLVSGDDFINSSGNDALNATTGRWLVYSVKPADDTSDNLASDFRRFSCTYGGSCPTLASGDGFLYSFTPTVTITPNQTISYGSTINLNGYTYTTSGYLDSDASIDNRTGTLVGTTTYVQGNNAGSYNINRTGGTLTSSMGYAFTYANSTNGLTVNPRAITVTANPGQTKTHGSSNPTYTYNISAGSLYGSDHLGGALSRATGEDEGPYAITQGSLNGAGNYNITFVGSTFTILAGSGGAPDVETEIPSTVLYMSQDPIINTSFMPTDHYFDETLNDNENNDLETNAGTVIEINEENESEEVASRIHFGDLKGMLEIDPKLAKLIRL